MGFPKGYMNADKNHKSLLLHTLTHSNSSSLVLAVHQKIESLDQSRHMGNKVSTATHKDA